MFLALQGNDVDVIAQFAPAGAAAILNNPTYKIIKLKSANHRELSMRNDQAPFTDARVRQAVAYTLDRPGAVAALLSGDGTGARTTIRSARGTPRPTRRLPSAPRTSPRPSSSWPQPVTRTASAPRFSPSSIRRFPQLAQVIVADAAKAGIKIAPKIESQSVYYGKFTFGNSDWLDGTMSLVDYGDRGAPNVYLTSPLTSSGVWNAARFKNPQYDAARQAVRGCA